MRKVERYVRRRLKQKIYPESIRETILRDPTKAGMLDEYAWSGRNFVSHWAAEHVWHPFCDTGAKLEYMNPVCIHFTEVACERAKVCTCLNVQTGEVRKHAILNCPDGKYRKKEE